MGSWGTGIYSNDIAEDVRDFCDKIFPFTGAQEGNRIVFKEFAEIIHSDIFDDDTASFWYALSDWQWKHGILSDEIRNITLRLLNDHAGISDWEEMGNQADVKKRISVMEQLKNRLNTPMPPENLPKKRLAKAKHKAGQIVIFQTKCDDQSEFWEIDSLMPSFFYQEKKLTQTADALPCVWNAQGKYMAILCVGTEKTPYSSCLPDLFEEHSIYAFYDFISEKPPEIAALRKCGFLPMMYLEWKDFNRNIIEYIGWTYRFTLGTQRFQVSKKSNISAVCTCRDESEVQRFQTNLSQKNYLNDVAGYFELQGVFDACWSEKKRLETVGMRIDTLMDDKLENPRFKTPKEIMKIYHSRLMR